jgi:hypothetical protein
VIDQDAIVIACRHRRGRATFTGSVTYDTDRGSILKGTLTAFSTLVPVLCVVLVVAGFLLTLGLLAVPIDAAHSNESVPHALGFMALGIITLALLLFVPLGIVMGCIDSAAELRDWLSDQCQTMPSAEGSS